MPAQRSIDLAKELSNYGVNGDGKSVRWFRGQAGYDLIEYLDLIQPQGPRAKSLLKPDGVVENQDRPLLFFVDHSHLASSQAEQCDQLNNLRRSLACRGDRAYLAVIRPGVMDVIPVSLKDKSSEWREFEAGTTESLTFFPRLAVGRCRDLPAGNKVDFLFKEMYTLVESSASRLEKLRVKRTDVLSLVGRALFFRFLYDRGIIQKSDLKKIARKADSLIDCFDNAENAAATCRWLDKTFNGDFLPLSENGNLEFFQSLGKRTGNRVFFHLGAIARGEEPSGDDGYQARLKIDWGDLDFAHIPVGLLSQVYEKLSWKWDRDVSKNTSVHYTPRNIAATLVGEAFDNLPNAHAAKVLDPACGASIFLVIAFRRLYRELWENTKQRPDTEAIRNILENQLVGFDISDSALKLSALSLYLTAIELDPDPVPPEKLRFKKLRSGKNAILFDWREEDDKPNGPVVGSIGKHVGNDFDNRFDLILCNPPWTNIGSEYSNVSAELDSISQEIVTSLDSEIGKGYKNPDSVPDLPFVWKSIQWCKPDGRIAMALPARTLFKQGPMAQVTRNALFKLIEVNGIVNGSNLRKTQVWPDMNQPFMLLFATNRKPKANHRLHFISPHTDLHSNALGEMRIDSKSSKMIDLDEVIDEPWIWKALAVGTELDIEVIQKIKETGAKPFKDYWVKELGLTTGQGYQIAENQKKQNDASALNGFPDLKSRPDNKYFVDTSNLKKFELSTLFRTRERKKKSDPLEIYRGPMALVNVSPGEDRSEGRALLCLNDCVFSESYYGYSSSGHKESTLLAQYVQLWVHCDLLMYYALLTSAEIGFERPKFQKRDLDKFPFIPFERLGESCIHDVTQLSERLVTDDPSVFSDIDDFFGQLYGLSRWDIEVIADTLEVREPSDELGKRASEAPNPIERKAFLRRVSSHLRPLFKVLGKEPELNFWKPSEKFDSPFLVFTLSTKGTKSFDPEKLFQNEILPLANETGATRIILESDGTLVIGILRQYRYWTKTQARLLGAEIMRNYMSIFES